MNLLLRCWYALWFPPRRALAPLPIRASRFGIILTLVVPTLVHAQGRVRDFTEPVLVHNSEGHSGPVRALVFPKADGSVLLSAGLDKVVNEWDLDGPASTPTRTLRPPAWRGRRGEIRAMALSPRADAQGQRILAVGGSGIAYNSADVVLFRYPGLDLAAQATGDLLAHLPVATVDAPDAGHRDPILRLAFNSDGSRLASASVDGTVRIWDVERRVSVAVLRGHQGQVRGLAWLNDGQVATGDEAGDVRVWELAPVVRESARVSVRLDEARSALDFILGLVASADGRTVMTGDGRGRVVRFDAPTLANPVRYAPKPDQGGVIALALSADGSRFAASYRRRVVGAVDWGNRASDVEVRSTADGASILPTITLDDYATAVAFSPDNRRFLYAGGPSQAIHVRSIAPVVADETPKILRGHGSTIREVAFGPDGLGLAVARRRFSQLDPAEDWEGFDLDARRPRTFPANTLRRAESTLGGWTLEPISPTRLDVVHQNGVRLSVTTDLAVDGDRWCQTLLAPRRAGEHPLLAVGCTAGVILYTISPELKRTRYLAGHEGEVLSLAASADGRWLATSGDDQTARLWSLADAEKTPGFGAKLERGADGAFRFVAVDPLGIADGMGIGPGDQLLEAIVGGKRVELDAFQALADAATPGPSPAVSIRIVKAGDGPIAARTVGLTTTKRNSPAVSLFLADRPAGEWVLWTPLGAYDSSIGGDRRYLGWRLNQSADIAVPKATLYYPIARFEDRLRQPDAIRLLLATGDEPAFIAEALRLTLAQPSLIVVENRPPRLGAMVASVVNETARIRIKAETLGGKALRSLSLTSGSKPLRAIDAPANQGTLEGEYDISLEPGSNRVGVQATDADGRTETTWIVAKSAAAPKRSGRLIVAGFGAERFGSAGLPMVPHAERDADALAAFLSERLLTPGEAKPFASERIEREVWKGSEATSAGLAKTLDGWIARTKSGELRSGDQIALVVETHLLLDAGKPLLAGSDLVEGASPALPAAGLAEALGTLTKSGVRVLLFLDVVHRDLSTAEGRIAAHLIRDLRDKRGVVVFVASGVKRPSEPRIVEGKPTYPTFRQRLFAQAILNTTNASAGRAVRVDDQGRTTLDGFHLTVNEGVKSLTRGKQLTGCYAPESEDGNAAFLNLKTPR